MIHQSYHLYIFENTYSTVFRGIEIGLSYLSCLFTLLLVYNRTLGRMRRRGEAKTLLRIALICDKTHRMPNIRLDCS